MVEIRPDSAFGDWTSMPGLRMPSAEIRASNSASTRKSVRSGVIPMGAPSSRRRAAAFGHGSLPSPMACAPMFAIAWAGPSDPGLPIATGSSATGWSMARSTHGSGSRSTRTSRSTRARWRAISAWSASSVTSPACGTSVGGLPPAIARSWCRSAPSSAMLSWSGPSLRPDPSGIARVMPGQHQGERYRALLQVVAHGLANLLLGGEVVENIVGDLERHPELAAEAADGVHLGFRQTAENGAAEGRRREQNGRFPLDLRVVLLEGLVVAPLAGELQHLAEADRHHRLREQRVNAGVPDL